MYFKSFIINHLNKIKEQANSFFLYHPALEFALILVFSISIYNKGFYVIIPLSLLCLFRGVKRVFTVLVPLLMTCLVGLLFWYGGSMPQGTLKGKALVHLQKVTYSSGFFGSSWNYSGVIKNIKCGNQVYRNLPFTFYRKGKLGPLDPTYHYEVEGEVKKKQTYGYRLKVLPNAEFKKRAKNLGIVKLRFELKKKFKHFLKSKIKSRSAREFLIGISTGDFSNTYLSFTFARFGLNHLLAISGFHFGLLLLFLDLILLHFLPEKIRTPLLILGLTAFYFFVGDTPSLSRAWIVACVYLLGSLLKQPKNPLNTLSLSMCIVLLMDPLMLFHMGFQFSFLVTFGILLYYAKIEKWILKKRAPQNPFKVWFYKACALGLSVHIAAVPLTLYYFHKFYLLSFLFNLFIPSVVGVIIFVFLSALCLHCVFLTSIASWLFICCGKLTDVLLTFIFWIPTSVDYCIRFPYFSHSLLISYLTVFLVIGCFGETLSHDPFLDFSLEVNKKAE